LAALFGGATELSVAIGVGTVGRAVLVVVVSVAAVRLFANSFAGVAGHAGEDQTRTVEAGAIPVAAVRESVFVVVVSVVAARLRAIPTVADGTSATRTRLVSAVGIVTVAG